MCKFHKDVAKDIATDSTTGEFDPGKYAVALMAMAHFRVEQYMPSMFGCDGFIPAEMAAEEAQQALENANLRSCSHAIQKYRDDHIEAIRESMANTATIFCLTQEDLNIVAGEITKDGYKAAMGAEPDPTINGSFMDYAVVYLFNGYDDETKTYASGALSLTDRAPEPQYEAIRAATSHFVSQPGVMAVLKQMFEDSLVKIFKAAPADFAAGKGHEKTNGCVMCHDDERRSNASGATPGNTEEANETSDLKEKFMACARCARDGFGGAVLSHAGCFLAPAIAGVFGSSISGAFMAASMYVTSPLIAVGVTYGLDRWRGQRPSMAKLAGSAAIALAIAFGINNIVDHGDHRNGHEHHQHHEHHQLMGHNHAFIIKPQPD